MILSIHIAALLAFCFVTNAARAENQGLVPACEKALRNEIGSPPSPFAFTACQGVKSEAEIEAVVSCVSQMRDTIGNYWTGMQYAACTGVKNPSDALAVATCAGRVNRERAPDFDGDGSAFLVCQGVKNEGAG